MVEFCVFVKVKLEIYLQNGGGWDQNPVSVQTILASPSSWWASLQTNCTRLPTA